MLRVGDKVLHGPTNKEGRVIATSGTDQKCLVEFYQKYNDWTKVRVVTPWLSMDAVALAPVPPEEKKESA